MAIALGVLDVLTLICSIACHTTKLAEARNCPDTDSPAATAGTLLQVRAAYQHESSQKKTYTKADLKFPSLASQAIT